MSVFYVLVPVALLLAGAGVLAFRWAVRDGQFDDVETPALRMLLDDEPPPPESLQASESTPRSSDAQSSPRRRDRASSGASPSSGKPKSVDPRSGSGMTDSENKEY